MQQGKYSITQYAEAKSSSGAKLPFLVVEKSRVHIDLRQPPEQGKLVANVPPLEKVIVIRRLSSDHH